MGMTFSNNLRTTCGHGTPLGHNCWWCTNHGSAVSAPVGIGVITANAPQTFLLGGWQCPGCQRCYAPAMVCCPVCPQEPAASTGADPAPPQQRAVGIGEGFTDVQAQVQDEIARAAVNAVWDQTVYGTAIAKAGGSVGVHACPKPLEGSLCGCGDDEDGPSKPPCTSVECDC